MIRPLICASLSQLRWNLCAPVILAILPSVLIVNSASAADYTVTTNADSGAGSLRQGILNANAAGGTYSIDFNITGTAAQRTITLSSMLPVLANPNGISIDGANGANGAVIVSGNSTSNTTGDRIFFVGVGTDAGMPAATTSTSFSISNLTLSGGNGRGGAGGSGRGGGGGGGAGLGGAIFVNAGTLNLSNIQFAGNRAVGGNGATDSSSGGNNAGGGGGLGGAGGSNTNTGSTISGGAGGGFGLTASGSTGNGAGGTGTFTGASSGGSGGSGAAGGANAGGGGSNGGNAFGGGGGGAAGGTPTNLNGAAGGFGGGGGGSGANTNNGTGGNGGFGGGGGSGSQGGAGGNGGFGGGGGGGGTGGFGGGNGGSGASTKGGGGGAGLGGAVYVRQGATLNITDGSITSDTVTAGTGANSGTAGIARGQAAFLAGNLSYSVSSGTVLISEDIGGKSTTTDSAGLVTGNFTKAGAGTLALSNAANTFATHTGGTSTITGGALRLDNAGALPGGISAAGGTSNLVFNGGVLGLNMATDFNRGLGTGATQVQWTGSGGFAAYTAARTANIGGAGATMIWNSGSFVPTSSALILGADTADNTVTFVNPIDFSAAARTIQADNGSAAVDAILSGALSNGGLTKTGNGNLQLTSANSYAGATTVSAGTLSLGTGGSINSSVLIDVAAGATFDASAVGGFTLGAGKTLKGSGTIVGTTTINGLHAPGASPGIETIMGDYILNDTLEVEIQGSTAGVGGYDQIFVTDALARNVTLNSSTSILDDLFSGSGWSAPSDKLWILLNDTAGTLTGVFSNYATNGMLVTNYDGRNWNIYYSANFTTDSLTGGNDVVIAAANDVLAVPEPSSLALGACGLAGLLGMAWVARRRNIVPQAG